MTLEPTVIQHSIWWWTCSVDYPELFFERQVVREAASQCCDYHKLNSRKLISENLWKTTLSAPKQVQDKICVFVTWVNWPFKSLSRLTLTKNLVFVSFNQLSSAVFTDYHESEEKRHDGTTGEKVKSISRINRLLPLDSRNANDKFMQIQPLLIECHLPDYACD